MEPIRCAKCQSLQRRVHDLQAENETRRRQLDEVTRAGKRQAAPFAKNPVRGPLHNDGSYQVNNVPLGQVKIAVLTPPPSPPPRKDDPKPPPPSDPAVVVPPKYANPDTSGLTCDVTGGSQTYPIDLK